MVLTEAKLISLRDSSLSYNLILDKNIIQRDYLLDEIEEIALNDNKLIIIEGNEGIGKTSILLQFATRHNFDCFTYFINPACRFTAKQDFLMEDIGKQISFFLNADNEDTFINEGTFNNLLFNLLRVPQKKGRRLYFIIDGLDQIEKAETDLLKSVLENLPWSTNNFTFIISGSTETLTEILPENALKKSKSFRIIRFSYEETCKFFGWTDNVYSKEVHETWNGHPERLSQVKRILDGGIDLKDFLIRDDIREKNDLLEIEWKQADIDKLNFDSQIIKLICILCFDENIRSFNKIVSILTCDDSELKQQIKGISFLKLKDDDISFISKSYRQFATGKLNKNEKKTFALLISYYTEKDDLSSVLNLPSLYDRSQDWSSLINLLTVNNLDLIVSGSQSFADIKKQINYGYKASRSLKKAYEDIFRFSLYRSLIAGLQKSDMRETQIQAYITLNKQEEAFSLISGAILKEDRLKMMVTYAKECKIRNLSLDILIIKEIELLVLEIDKDYLNENITDLAIGIAYFNPNLAVDIIEKAAGLKSESGSLEWLMSYIGTIISENKSNVTDDKIKIADDPLNRLNETLIEKLSKSIGFGINDISENEIVAKISDIENIADKIFMIRAWIRKNYQAHNIVDIMDYGIDLLLQSSSVIKPTTTNLLEILYPLTYVSDKNIVIALTKRVDGLIVSINSPTSDKIRLQLMVIEAISIYDMDNANQRIIDLYDMIHVISDYAIKIEAYADCWNSVKRLNEKSVSNAKEFILDESDVKKEIINSTDTFLNSIADHFDELENVFEIISKIDFDFSVQLSLKLNTSINRSEALNIILSNYAELNIKEWDINKIKYGLSLIDIDPYYVSSLIAIFNSASDQKEDSINFKNKIAELVPLININIGNSLKCHLLSKCMLLLIPEPTIFMNIKPKYDKLLSKLKDFLKTQWGRIDNPVERIKTGYKLTSAFADYDKSLSEEFFKQTEEISDEYVLDNQTHIVIYIEAIRLMIRIYSGIIIKNKNYSYEKIDALISHIPSKISRLRLWSELAVRVKLEGNNAIADEIVSKKINPFVERYKGHSDKFYFYSVLKISASAIYLSQPEALKLLIEPLPIYQRENIISIVCFVSISKVHESEPFNDIKGSASFKYQDAVEFINLIDMMETDHELFYNIRHLCSVGKHFPNNFTREQKTDIKRRLELLINKKLPNNKTGVKHIGYSIVSRACILNFNNNQANDRIKEFESLEKEVLNIPNIADRSIVYTILAKECGIKKKKADLINKSFDEADQTLSVKQKINLYEIALEEASLVSLELFNAKINKIQSEIVKLDESDKFPTYRKLIDLAYKNDKQLAKRLISAVDTDPGRKQLIEPINSHYEKLELEKNVLEDYSQIGKIKNRKTMGKITYRMMGELNSDKRQSRNLEQSISLLHTASKLPFFHSLPLIEFFVQNYIKNSATNENQFLAFYDAAYSNAKLCYNLICNISNKKESTMLYSEMESENTFVARFGMRDLALEFIERYVKLSNSKDIYIIDSYFSYGDVWFLKTLYGWSEKAHITILTSSEANREFSKFHFKNAWNEISSEDFPQSYFISASNGDSKSPIHDRWILFADCNQGLRIGSSINAIGGKKICEISTIHSTEVESLIETVVVPFVKQKVKDYDDQIIKYETFEF